MVTILAIDDNKDNLISLKAIIQDAFPDSVFFNALNGQIGIELAIKHDPDVILVDIVMPEMDGFEVCQILKKDERTHDIPVVFLTANTGSKENRIKALDAGAEAFLSKPIDDIELTAQIKSMAKIKQANKKTHNEKVNLELLVAERTLELEESQAETLQLLEELKVENEKYKKAESELRESEEKYRLLHESAGVGIGYYTPDGTIISYNKVAAFNMNGEPEDFAGKSIYTLFPREDGDFYMDRIKKAVNSEIRQEYEDKVELPKGVKWFQSVFTQIQDSSKKVIGVQIISTDITKRKEAENLLKANEESVRLLNKLTSEMLEIQDLESMYGYIVNNLQARNPDTTILYNSIDEKNNISRLEIISGIGNSRWNKIMKIAGFNPIGKKYELTPIHTDYFRSGKLVEFEGGLVEFASSELSPAIARTIQKTVKLNKIYTIGIIKNSNLLAAIHFFTFNSQVITDIDFIETMVGQAGILLQKKMAEQALKDSEEKYRRLAESMKDVVWTIDAESLNYIYLSPSVTKLRGYTTEEVMAEPLIAAMSPSYQTQVREEIRERTIDLLAGRISSEKYFINEALQRCKNGSLVWTEMITHLLVNQLNGKVELHGVTRDITDRKRAEMDLRDSETRLKRAELTSKSGNWELYLDSQKVLASEGAKKIYGIDESEFGYSVAKEIPLPQYRTLLDETLVKLVKDNQPYDVEFKIKAVNTGEIKDVHSVALYDKEKRVLFGVIQDITKRKKAEELLKENEIRLSELVATKDKFFSIISHDLNSPFNSILGLSNLLVEQIQEKNYDGIEEYASIIQTSSQRAMELLKNLLDWSRSQTNRIEFSPEYVEVVNLINEVTTLLNEAALQKSIEIVKELPRNMLTFGDKAMISTILRNLISNSIKFTQTGGQIVISAVKNKDELIITVADDGVGIKKEAIGKLFQIAENQTTLGTRNEKGTGLGLILCKEFVEKHGGKIWVESTLGVGSKFSFSIPKL